MITPKTPNAGEDSKKLNHLMRMKMVQTLKNNLTVFFKKKVCNYHYVAIALLGIFPREKKNVMFIQTLNVT